MDFNINRENKNEFKYLFKNNRGNHVIRYCTGSKENSILRKYRKLYYYKNI